MSNRRLRAWSWFAVWALAGVALAFAGIVFQPFVAVVALVAVGALAWRGVWPPSTLGLISGAGIMLLIVAYIQRKGPGTVYWHTATARGADQYLDPRPWLAGGIVLVVGGVAAFAFLRRRAHHESHQPTWGGRSAG